ncbi:MAG: glycosyltransferase [Chitinophagaceae bacterium]|nr:MAG: glycosyltransferase [Chitinophagaceae bacterium]
MRKSDGIICLTNAAKKIIEGWTYYNPSTPLKVIPCSADLQLFDPAAVDKTLKADFASRLSIKDDDFIISYLGSIGGWYLTTEMMRFCKLLIERMPNARFLFISPHRHEEIIASAREQGIPKTKIIIVKAKRKDVPILLSFSKYSIFFIKPCFSKLSSSPTKHGELLAMGIPVITNGGVGDMREITTNYKAGFIIDDFTDESYNNVITQIASGAEFDKMQMRSVASEVYALENAVSAYIEMYSKILGVKYPPV